MVLRYAPPRPKAWGKKELGTGLEVYVRAWLTFWHRGQRTFPVFPRSTRSDCLQVAHFMIALFRSNSGSASSTGLSRSTIQIP